MDPNATLIAFIDARTRYLAAPVGSPDELNELRTAIGAASDLFDWLAFGGFRPAWRAMPRVPATGKAFGPKDH